MNGTDGRNAGVEGKLFRRAQLRVSPEQRNAIYQSILDSSHIDIEYAALLILAGLIALFGLLENSAAVIIGAMLISPLMNPILSAALALLLGDGKLGRRAAAVLAISIAGVIGKLKYRVGISTLVLLLLSIPLFLTLRKAAIEVAIRSTVQRELKQAFKADEASVSDLSFTRAPNGLLIQATLRTGRYIETTAIGSVEDNLRRKFGPDSKLQIDQILVTHGGIKAGQPVARQSPISGGVIKQLGEKTTFDFKGSGLERLKFVQNQVDAILAGTDIKRKAAPEIDLGPVSPLILRLRLSSSEPLSEQTVALLASQLGSKLGLPVQLRGQAELEGPSFQLALETVSPGQGLDAEERATFTKLLAKVQQDNLRLQVTCAPGQRSAGDHALPAIISDIRRRLSESKLKNSQWMIAIEPTELSSAVAGNMASPTAGVGSGSTETGDIREFHCNLRSFQDF